MRAILLLLVFLSPPTPGAVLESGETKTRYAKLSLALEVAKAGDTVRLEPGDHRGSFELPAGVKLVGDGKARLIQTGGRPGLLLKKAGRVEIHGCRIAGSHGPAVRVAERAVAILDRCVFDVRSGYAVYLTGTQGSEIRRCRFVDAGIRMDHSKVLVTRTEFRANGGSGIYIAGKDESRIEHCRLTNARISVFGAHGTQIVKNRIEGNGNHAIWLDRAAAVTLRGNLLRGNAVGIAKGETATGTWHAPDVYPLGKKVIEDNVLVGNDVDHAGFLSDPQHRLVLDPVIDGNVGIGDESDLPPAVPGPPAPTEVGSITGRVLTAEGDPVSEAWVLLRFQRSQRYVRTTPTGTFRFTNVAAGPWHPGAGAVGWIYRRWPQRCEVRAGEETKLPDLILEPDRPVRGTVEDGRGRPARGAVVYALDYDDPMPIGAGRAVAEWGGRFEVRQMRPGRRTLLAFRRLANEDNLLVAHLYPDVETGRRGFHLTRGVERVGVRVTDPEGKPVPEFDLSIWGKPDVGGELIVTKWDRIWDPRNFDWPVRFEDRVDPLRLLLPPGTYHVVVRRREHGRAVRIAHQAGLTIEKENSRSIDLVLERPGRITGRVLDEDGKGIEFATIRSAEAPESLRLFELAFRDPEALYTAETDELGKFRIDPVMPGDRRLIVRADGYREKVVTVAGVSGRKTTQITVVLTH